MIALPFPRIPALVTLAVLACTTTSVPARAEVRHGAQEAIDQWLAASGGREARDAERTVRMKGRLNAAELKGTYQLWLAAPDKWAVQIRLGSLHIREGFDGQTAWRTDLSGRTVVVLDGAELEDAKEEAFFLHERWSEPDHGGADIRLGAKVFGAEAAYRVIEVASPGGQTRRMFVNQKSGLIDKVETLHPGGVALERWSAYGKKDAHRRHRVVEWGYPRWGEKDPEKLVIDSVLVNLPIDDAVFSPPELRERKIAWLKTRGRARIPFRYGTKHVWVRVSVNGSEPADFILDTGASSTAIDRDWAYSVGLEPEGRSVAQGFGGTAELQFARVKSLQVRAANGDGVRLPDFRAGLIDMADEFEPTLWRKPAGLLGGDFLSHFVVTIDYDSSVVTLYDPERWHAPEGAEALPMKMYGNIPTVEMTLGENCGGWFLVDVGNSGGLDMHGEAVRRCRLFQGLRRDRVEMYGGGVGGVFQVTMCRMDSLSLGSFTWDDPIVGLSLHGQGMLASEDVAGNIGNGILEKFRCVFDYPGGRLWLTPGRRFEDRDRLTRLGALLVRLPERVIVGPVISGSPADEAGLRLFDEVLEIDGRPAIAWSREEFDRKIEDGPIGATHVLRIRRWRVDEMTVEVSLRDVL